MFIITCQWHVIWWPGPQHVISQKVSAYVTCISLLHCLLSLSNLFDDIRRLSISLTLYNFWSLYIYIHWWTIKYAWVCRVGTPNADHYAMPNTPVFGYVRIEILWRKQRGLCILHISAVLMRRKWYISPPWKKTINSFIWSVPCLLVTRR